MDKKPSMDKKPNGEEPKTPAPIWEQEEPSKTPGKQPGESSPQPHGGDEPPLSPGSGQPSSGGVKHSGR